jgi:hypothetical protein
MNVNDAIRATAGVTSVVLTKYVDDLSDADLLTRPGPGCNHLAWQLGHLISSNVMLLESIRPGESITLPEGFAEAHGKETIGVDDPAKFSTKAEYLGLMDQVQTAALAALDTCSESDLDEPSPEHFRNMFPTVGHMFVLIATHGLMHAGQFVPVRRALDKPVVI